MQDGIWLSKFSCHGAVFKNNFHQREFTDSQPFFQTKFFCLQPGWSIADPICTFLFSFLVLLTTINILRDALHILCEGNLKFIWSNPLTWLYNINIQYHFNLKNYPTSQTSTVLYFFRITEKVPCVLKMLVLRRLYIRFRFFQPS